MVTTRPPKTIVKPTALGPVANTDTKLLIYGLFQKGRVLAQDGVPDSRVARASTSRFRNPLRGEHVGAARNRSVFAVLTGAQLRALQPLVPGPRREVS